MPEETLVAGPSKVKYNGVFSLSDFYRLLYDLFVSQGYVVEETKYKEKNESIGKQIEISWEGEKLVDDYTKFVIKVTVFMIGINKVKVQKDGVEAKMNKGDVEISFKAILTTDYDSRWESSPVLKFLKGVYDTYLYRSTFDSWRKQIYEEMYSIQNEMKAFFNLSRFM